MPRKKATASLSEQCQTNLHGSCRGEVAQDCQCVCHEVERREKKS